MDKSLGAFDWSLIQSFLAVADSGSLTGAATALGQSQPTVGRHIKELEEQLEAELFLRHPRGLSLAPMGEDILPLARHMQSAMAKISVHAEAGSARVAGTVRIACSVFAAHHVLPPVIAQLREAEPEISLVLQPSDDSENLTFREADIAVRMYRPQQLDLVTRKIADIEMGTFAAKSYIQRRGAPTTLQDLFAHDVVGYDQSPLMVQAMRDMGHHITPEAFAVRTDNQSAYWELVRAGCGIGFTQAHLGRSDPLVQELALGIDIPPLPIWLTARQDVRRIPRVDRIWQLLLDLVPEVLRQE
ncbi:MAG: LysR family transcriptional regulator [Pseudomonadota bacterium]